jgi:hypothetical protein
VFRCAIISAEWEPLLPVEFFNALNHTNFGNPGAVFGSPTFGVISAAGPARQIEAGMRILF